MRGHETPVSFVELLKVRVKVDQQCLTLWGHLYSPWNSPGQNTGVDSLSLLQRIFPTQGSNPGLPHYRWIFYQLSYQGSPDELLYDSKKWQMNARLQSTPALTFFYTSRWRTPWPWSHSGVNNLPFLGKWSWTEIWTIGSVKNNPASLQLVKHHYAKTSE